MNTFPIEIIEIGMETIMYDVAKDCSDEEMPIYLVKPNNGFDPAFRLTKTEQGWKQVPPTRRKYPQSFIDKAGREIEQKEPDDFDPDYDEEAELRMMGLDDEETNAGVEWTLGD